MMDAKRRQMRATALAESDLTMLIELVELRRRGPLTQDDVAELLGVSQQAVSAFERLESDPRLSTIRQYAHAIGALVRHDIRADEGRDDNLEWLTFSHDKNVTVTLPANSQINVSRDAMNSAKTDFVLGA